MRSFDTIAALVETQIKLSRNSRITDAANRCLEDENHRGSAKYAKFLTHGDWQYIEYRLARDNCNVDLGWAPVLNYSFLIKTKKHHTSILLEAISGIMSDNSTGRVIQLTIETPQHIPQSLWSTTSARLGHLIELPTALEHLADCTIDELDYQEVDKKGFIRGYFDLHMPGQVPIHESRPVPDCLRRMHQEQEQMAAVKSKPYWDELHGNNPPSSETQNQTCWTFYWPDFPNTE